MMCKIKEFYNDSCGACKLLKPILDEISTDLNVEVLFINIDEHPDNVTKYNISSLPTVIFMDGDEEVYRFIGYRPKLFIEAQLKRLGLIS